MDILFLLHANFTDTHRDNDNKHYYCPDCAFLEGVSRPEKSLHILIKNPITSLHF